MGNALLVTIAIVVFSAFFSMHKKEKSGAKQTPLEDPPIDKMASESVTPDCPTIFHVQAFTESPILQPVTLSEEQKEIFKEMEYSDDHLFITGRAGTGKSSLLNYFKEHTHKEVAVCAPTGIAALLVKGQTIHSLLWINPQSPFYVPENDAKELYGNSEKLLKKLDTLVIDEISMVRADLMDMVNLTLQKTRNNFAPFGGVQIIMFGDLYQLPPIVQNYDSKGNKITRPIPMKSGCEEDFCASEWLKSRYDCCSFHFFKAEIWRSGLKMRPYSLGRIFRQNDKSFRDALNVIREGKKEKYEEAFHIINKRVGASKEGLVTITPRRKHAKEINEKELAKINAPALPYNAVILDKNAAKGMFGENGVVEEKLVLKVGAQVMFIVNDSGDNNQRRWHNGTIGKVHSLDNSSISVDIKNKIIDVPRHTWNKIKHEYDEERGKSVPREIPAVTQFPLRLAWAMTIHKSQGQTFEEININLYGGAFDDGQLYVALSRCKTLDGIHLACPINPSDIKVSKEADEFMKRAERRMSSQ